MIHHREDGTQASLAVDKDTFHQGIVAEGHGGQPSQVFLHIGKDSSVHALFTIGDTGGFANSSTHVEQFHVEVVERYHNAYAGAVMAGNSSDNGSDHLVYRYEDIHPTYFNSLPKFCGAVEHESASNSVKSKQPMDYLRHRRSAFDINMQAHGERAERSSGDCRSQDSGTGGKCDCPVALVADTTFVNADFLEGDGDAGIAAQYMINMAIQADAVYRKTYFSGQKG